MIKKINLPGFKSIKNNLGSEVVVTDDIEVFKDKERFKPYIFPYAGYKVHLNDPLSFYYEVKYIFDDQIHYFATRKKKPFIIDGGAYIGDSIFYFKKIYPDAEVLAFEPDPTILEYLYKNIRENDLKSIKVVEKGLYSKEGELAFEGGNTNGGKIAHKGDSLIPTTMLSSYINKPVDFLKLNIEGAELEVCKDLDKSGKFKFIDQLCMEWHSFGGEEQNLDQILKLLTENGFKYYISGLSGLPLGRFHVDNATQYYLMIYARRLK